MEFTEHRCSRTSTERLGTSNGCGRTGTDPSAREAVLPSATMRRFAVALAVYAFTLSGASSAQQQPTTKTILLFIDDLQILFRDTPRLRTGLKQVSERLTTAGWSFAVASDGSSEVSIAPTSDTTALVSIANKISGGGLTPNELANPTPYVERDITRRSIMARREL